jgi:cyanophycinase
MARTFLLLGSGEFEPWTHDVEREALAAAVGDGSVAICPAASATEGEEVFGRWSRMGLDHYAEAGVPAAILPVRAPEDAHEATSVTAAEAASIVYFSGGKPTYLAEVLHGSPLLAGIERALDRGAVWAGCSAGAMVVSRARSGGTGGMAWRFGLGLVPHVAFGVHWDRVRRVPGAAWWMSSRLPDDTWFVGIDERTAILGDGEGWTVHGLGQVTVRRDGRTATYEAGRSFETPQASR